MHYEEEEKCRQLARMLLYMVIPTLVVFVTGIILLLVMLLT